MLFPHFTLGLTPLLLSSFSKPLLVSYRAQTHEEEVGLEKKVGKEGLGGRKNMRRGFSPIFLRRKKRQADYRAAIGRGQGSLPLAFSRLYYYMGVCKYMRGGGE